MTRRQRDIVLLLGALPDAPFAQMKNWTSELVRRNAIRGEVPAHRVPCPACNGRKQRRVRTVMQPCDRCVGAKGNPLGYIVVDLNINDRFRRRIGTDKTGVEQQHKIVPCDSCGGARLGNGKVCPYCRGGGVQELTFERWRAGRVSITVETREPVGIAVIDAMDERRQQGSFDELVAALYELKLAWPTLYRLTLRRYGLHRRLPDERLQRLVDEGAIPYLEARMPEPIRVPGWVKQREKAAA